MPRVYREVCMLHVNCLQIPKASKTETVIGNDKLSGCRKTEKTKRITYAEIKACKVLRVKNGSLAAKFLRLT